MKKLLVGLTSVATIALMAGPALAFAMMGGSDITVVNNNDAHVTNTVNVSASTGSNEIVAVKGGGNSGDIRTGDAGAASDIVNIINTTITRVRR